MDAAVSVLLTAQTVVEPLSYLLSLLPIVFDDNDDEPPTVFVPPLFDDTKRRPQR